MPFTVPGIGYAGLGQQTAAGQLTFRKAMGGSVRRAVRVRVRGRARRTSARLTRRMVQTTPRGSRRSFKAKRSSRSRSKALVKGSAAAKRYMAKIRRMRKR
ncbi:MAG TPA: hypothetical protein VIV56_04180 [Gemmatimonadales bacterium]